MHIKHVFDQGLEHILEPRGGDTMGTHEKRPFLLCVNLLNELALKRNCEITNCGYLEILQCLYTNSNSNKT